MDENLTLVSPSSAVSYGRKTDYAGKSGPAAGRMSRRNGASHEIKIDCLGKLRGSAGVAALLFSGLRFKPRGQFRMAALACEIGWGFA